MLKTKISIDSFFIPEFMETQRKSFLKLIDQDIPNEINQYNPIELTIDKKKPKNLSKKKWLSTLSYYVETRAIKKKSQTLHLYINNFHFSKLNGTYIYFISPKFIRYKFGQTNAFDSISQHLGMNNSRINPLKFHQTDFKKHPHRLMNLYPKQVCRNFKFPRISQKYETNSNRITYSPPPIQMKQKRILEKKQHKSEKFVVYFYPNQYKLIPSNETAKTALLKGKTYSAPIYVPSVLKNSHNQIVLSHWILLGNLPLMTNRGHFIINGTPRVILHQLVRSPGVYFHQSKKRSVYYADIICYRGVWLRIETDKKGMIWMRMKNLAKIPAPVFLQSMGLDYPHLLSQLEFPFYLNRPNKTETKSSLNGLGRNVFETSNNAKLLFDLFVGDTRGVFNKNTHIRSLNITREFFLQKFSPKVYNLSCLGRQQLNQKLGLRKKSTETTLTLDDLICIINYLIQVQNGKLTTCDPFLLTYHEDYVTR